MTTNAKAHQMHYVSLRWRLILPTFAIVLILAMVSAYIVARSLPSSADMSRVNVLLTNGRAVAGRAAALYADQATSLRLLGEMPEVAAAMQDRSAGDLHDLLENFARRADLDSVIASDASGQDVYGLLRDNSGAYSPTTRQMASGLVLFTSTPITSNGVTVGTVYVGTRYARWLDAVRAGAAVEVAVYQSTRLLAATTNSLPATLPQQYVQSTVDSPFQALDVQGASYLGAYFPAGRAVVGVFVPDTAPFAAEAGQQLIALTLATVAAGIVITLFVLTNLFLDRVNKVRKVVEALADGEVGVRTNMQPTDEIGALGRAIDIYTDKVQQRHDMLRASLRRQRREVEHLNAVLESLPDGVIIEDLDGNVTFINERGKKLIGEQYNFFKRAEMREITAAVTDTLGPAYAPGLYSLGTPQRMELDDRMLRVQAFAVTSMADQRVGTVIIVRDVTMEHQREQARAKLLEKMSVRTEKPADDEVISRQIRRNIGALQKMIVEMHELVSSSDAHYVQQMTRPLMLDTLVWAIANEWKQVAQAANVALSVNIERRGLQIFGDERRLRWALGNIIDNAIKYTPPGGKVSLEVKDEDEGYARLRVRDNGVGIAADELPNVFTRFFRGTPVNVTGRALRVPGTGQGLTIARQIIEAHRGRIYLRSSPGVGTAVYFTLPLSEVPVLEPIMETEDDEETLLMGTGS
jgi:signal transduction histidine kinase